jgi:hypothetical protein
MTRLISIQEFTPDEVLMHSCGSVVPGANRGWKPLPQQYFFNDRVMHAWLNLTVVYHWV